MGDQKWSEGIIKFKFLLAINDPKTQNWFSYGIFGYSTDKIMKNPFATLTNYQFTYSGDNKGYCGYIQNGNFHKEQQTDVKEGDVFIVTLDFKKLELKSYNERTKVTRIIPNLQNIPYRPHFILFGVQKIIILSD